MAIYTRFGNKVSEILKFYPKTGNVRIKVEDGSIYTRHYLSLKADDGIKEIINAIERTARHDNKKKTRS